MGNGMTYFPRDESDDQARDERLIARAGPKV